MTNEQAKDFLTLIKNSHDCGAIYIDEHEVVALDLAIKALDGAVICMSEVEMKPYFEGYKAGREDFEPHKGECKSCRHRDPEDKKCDCGGQERLGCTFPVSDDYYCKYYEKGGAE